MITFKVFEPKDIPLIKEVMERDWGGEPLIIRGRKYYPSALEGFLMYKKDKLEGYLFYDLRDHTCEIVVFEVFDKFKGVGSLALNKLIEIVKQKKCHRIFLMTTNDNLDALRFYQKRGFHICGIRLNSMPEARKLKPAIGEIGDYGIPLRDEIDLELALY